MTDKSKPTAILQRVIANGDTADTNAPRNNIGQLFRLVNNKWEWFSYSLEDALHADYVKVDGETCIEAGLYEMIVTFSPHFQREMVLLLPLFKPTVKFDGLRMHGGNTEADTRGCICIGYMINSLKNRISNSAEEAWTSWVKANNGGILLIENKQLSSNDELTKKILQ